MINRQQKTGNFMKLALSQRGDAPESDDIDIQDYEFQRLSKARGQQVHVQRKEPNIVVFLAKFTPQQMEKIDRFVESHKSLLNLPVPLKISLFEDAVILSEFLKLRAKIKQARVKTIQFICEQLQKKIKRAKMTIKERMAKKLSHCSVEEIMHAIEVNIPLNFDKNKSKKTYTSLETHSLQGMTTPVKQELIIQKPANHFDPLEDTFQIEKVQNFPLNSRFQNRAYLNSRQNFTAEKIYKYGTKQVKERIYIYANRDTSQLIPFPESRLAQMKNRFFKEVPQRPLEFSSPIRRPKDYFFKQQDDISSQVSPKRRDFDRQMMQKGLNRHLQVEQLIKQEITMQNIQKSLQQQALFKVSNNPHYLQIVKSNHNLRTKYVWSKDEDEALYKFKLKSSNHQEQIRCMLRHKSKQIITERAKFLSIGWNEEEFHVLDSLEEKKQIVKQENQDFWDIQ